MTTQTVAADPLSQTWLFWEHRTTSRVTDGQYRITVPCLLSAPARAGVHRALTAELQHWTGRSPHDGAWSISSVVVALGAGHGSRADVTLAITATPPDGSLSRRLDDTRMGRDLSHALTHLSPTPTTPLQRGTPDAATSTAS